jgi:hypothetical protein
MGKGTVDEVRARLPEAFLDPRRAARTCVALASGLFDAVTGQTIVVDEGWSLLSPANYLVGRDRAVRLSSGRRDMMLDDETAALFKRAEKHRLFTRPAAGRRCSTATASRRTCRSAISCSWSTACASGRAAPSSPVTTWRAPARSSAATSPGKPLFPGVLQIEAIGQAGVLPPPPRIARAHRGGDLDPRPRGALSTGRRAGRRAGAHGAGDRGRLFFTVVGQCLQRGEICSAAAVSGLL